MTQSLRSTLTLSLAGVLIPLLLGLGFAIDASVGAALDHQFDEGLAARVRDFATVVEREPDRYELEYDYATIPEYTATERPSYFEIWDSTGAALARSPSLQGVQLPRPELAIDQHIVEDYLLPDGRPGRLAALRFIPRLDEDILPGDAHRYQDPVVIAMAHGTEDVLATHRLVRGWLLLLCGTAVGLALAGAMWSVRRGLRPLNHLAAQIDTVDEHALSRRIDLGPVPRELLPPVKCLNALLGRLERSFDRERQFAGDASHELRTPLAALRMVLEVAASRDRSAAEYQAALVEGQRLVRQTTRLVESLLTLARAEQGEVALERSEVTLHEFVDECWKAHADAASRRGLRFTNDVDEALDLATDVARLWIVLGNLLDNAVAYTEADGAIVVRGPTDTALLEVWDSGPVIPEVDLPHLFDRLWRGNRARSEAELHCGLGLALAQAHARALGLQISAHNSPQGRVCFAISARDGGKRGP